jgi:predicted nucleotidyltransferase
MTQTPNAKLTSFIRKEWSRSVPVEVEKAAARIAERYGDSVLGVIFYGSCLRTGEIEDKILDFYVIVDSYTNAYKGRLLAVANKILPPNVFYHEMEVESITVRSKYAVLSLDDLVFRTSRSCLNVSVWARFCQPCMLLIPRDDIAFASINDAIAEAVKTMLLNLLDLKPMATASRNLWVEAFEQTYAAELRSERSGKGLEIYLLDQERYDRVTPLALAAMGVSANTEPQRHQPERITSLKPKLHWWARRMNGKIVSFLRLIKATTTFDGGIDYIAWKIRRHSGVEVKVVPWMRKWPVIAGITLFWNLRKKGAFK